MGGPQPPAPVAPSSEGQTYCLRWNNHQTNLVQILHALHEVGSYVDCTLVVDDEQFKAHRVVLAANSPYFQAILQDVPQDQCSIILPGVKGFEIAALLQYMYTGETTVTKSQEPEILRTAKELQVKGLYDNLMKFNHKAAGAAEERSQNHQFQGSTAAGGAVGGHPHHLHHHAAPTSSCSSSGKPHNGDGVPRADAGYGGGGHHHHNSSSVISTSTHISPSAAISSSCSPPPPAFGHAYQPPYTSFPASASGVPLNINAHIPAGEAPLTPTHSTPHHAAGEAGQWPLSPSAATAAAMLTSVYDSAADMNPLKRKKLSAISSMLFSPRDTPILRNVLANPADSSQPNPLLLPSKNSAEKTPTHQQLSSTGHGSGGGAGSAVGAGSHSFNGSDYGGDKEPLSPHTDRSFDDETGGGGGGGGGKKPEWKRYKQYTRADMMCAIQCVREGMSALQASRKFGLPSRTLYDKVRKLNITTGRGTHRTPKRSPPGESSAAFPYSAAAAAAAAAHNYGQTELDREPKEHGGGAPGAGPTGPVGHGHHGMPPTIPHSAAALLDHAFLQQALENRGGDIAGREALHAMALAAAAHAAANRMSSSPPGSNGHAAARGVSPVHHYGEEKHAGHQAIIKREAIEDERDADDEDDHDQVEDLSLQRKERPESPYSPPPPRAASPLESASVIMHSSSTNGGKEQQSEMEQEHEDRDDYGSEDGLKRERSEQLLASDEAEAQAQRTD